MSPEQRKAQSIRAKAQMADRKARGLSVGGVRKVSYERIRELRAHGLTYGQIAERMDCGIGSVYNALRKNSHNGMDK